MSNYLVLTETAKREVTSILRSNGLNPLKFSWEETRSPWYEGAIVSRLVLPGTDCFFLFDYRNGRECCSFSPGKKDPVEDEFTGNWQNQLASFKGWCERVLAQFPLKS